MADWTRVWGDGSGCGGSCDQYVCIPRQAVSNLPAATTSILDGLPTNVTTIGAAISVWMDRLRRRLDAKNCLVEVVTINTTYQATLPGATVTMTVSGGYFPLSIQYTKVQSTGSATFDNFPAALDWLVARLA